MPEYPLLALATQRPDLGHYVYRFYDSQGALLYIGSTGNLWYRIGQHAAEREWWPEVAWDRTLIELVSAAECSGRGCPVAEHSEMLRYEEKLIKDLRSRHNRLMTGYCRSGRHLLADHGKPAGGRGGQVCGACQSENMHRWYMANRAKALADANEYYQVNRERVREHRQRPEVKARVAAYMREYRERPGVRERANALRRQRYAERKAREGGET